LAELARRQHGVVTRRQLLDAGLTRTVVQRRLDSGHLLRLHRGVYAVGHAQLRREGRWLAAVLAVGDDAALSHRSAAALHGIRDGDGVIDVATARRVSVRGLVIHRAVLAPEDIATRAGVPVTTVARTLVDLAAVLPPKRVADLLREADRAGRLDAAALRGALDRAGGGCGSALRAALDEHERLATSLTRSVLEDRFLALLDADGLPRPLTNHRIEGMEVDAAWPEQRLVVELDGWAFHADRRAFQDDRTRAARLMAAGWVVLRFTHADVTERLAWVAATVRELLASPRHATMSDPCR
jgi:very-short-patch-repair endonuclease